MNQQRNHLEEIRQAIDGVRVLAEHDNKSAHCDEDKLYIQILRLIAEGAFKTKAEMQEAAALGVEPIKKRGQR